MTSVSREQISAAFFALVAGAAPRQIVPDKAHALAFAVAGKQVFDARQPAGGRHAGAALPALVTRRDGGAD